MPTRRRCGRCACRPPAHCLTLRPLQLLSGALQRVCNVSSSPDGLDLAISGLALTMDTSLPHLLSSDKLRVCKSLRQLLLHVCHAWASLRALLSQTSVAAPHALAAARGARMVASLFGQIVDRALCGLGGADADSLVRALCPSPAASPRAVLTRSQAPAISAGIDALQPSDLAALLVVRATAAS